MLHASKKTRSSECTVDHTTVCLIRRMCKNFQFVSEKFDSILPFNRECFGNRNKTIHIQRCLMGHKQVNKSVQRSIRFE